MTDDGGLTRCVLKYFQDPNLDQNNLLRFLELINQYAVTQRKLEMVEKIFKCMQSSITKDNTKIVYKRYLYIINEMLTRDSNFPQPLRYCQVLSQVLPTQYTTIIKSALTNATDLLILIKQYRKRWAKKITDEAFEKMRSEALKTLKFDLDKGFTEERIKKIQKEYKKRKFSNQEINKYMPSSRPKEDEEVGVRRSESSDSDSEGRPQKKNKVDRQRYQQREDDQIYKNDSMNSHSSLNPVSLGTHYVDPRQNTYFNPSYQYQTYQHNPYQNHLPNYYPNQQPYTPYQQPSPQQHNYHYPQQPYYNNPYQNYPTQHHQPVRKGTQVYDSMQSILTELSQAKGFVCQFCGLQFSTSQKHDSHMQLHFSESQKQYEISHSRRDHARKNLMPNIEQWMKSNSSNSVQLFVTVQGGSMGKQAFCVVCKGQLSVNWCEDLDSWVFEDAMRVDLGGQRQQICHQVCYNALTELEHSD